MTFWSHLDLACTCLINVNVKKKLPQLTQTPKCLCGMTLLGVFPKNKTIPVKVKFFLQSKAFNGPYSQNREKGDFISVRSEIILQVAK